jgi:hypothetical protein
MIDHTEGGKYRMLKEGELRREGDEFLGDDGRWVPTSCPGAQVFGSIVKRVRRPVANETVTGPDDAIDDGLALADSSTPPQITFPDRDAAVDALVRRVFGAEPVYVEAIKDLAPPPPTFKPVEVVGVIDVHGWFDQSSVLAAEWDESYPEDAPHRDVTLVEKLP